MKDFQAKRKFKAILFSWPVCLFFLVVNVILGRAVYELYKKERYTEKTMLQAETAYEQLQKRKHDLGREITRLSSPDGLDLELRRKFQVVKHGEEILVIVPTATTSVVAPTLPKSKSLWHTIQDFFGF